MANPKSKKGQPKPVTSRYCKPANSVIHQQGLFASRKIPADTEIIPYVGEKVRKKEGNKRAIDLAESREGTEDASVYMFILDDEYDIDGNVPHNTARLINHSCDPNCEAQIIEDEIWIVALRNIERDEELTFDYGFDLEHYEDHPCRCGSEVCVGYIVAEEYRPQLKKKLAANKKGRPLDGSKKKPVAANVKKKRTNSPEAASRLPKKKAVPARNNPEKRSGRGWAKKTQKSKFTGPKKDHASADSIQSKRPSRSKRRQRAES